MASGRWAQRCMALLACAMAAGSVAAAAEAPGLGWLRGLAGHCWRGELADGATADTQCYELQFERHLRGTIEMAGAPGQPPTLRGDSVWTWDAAKQRIVVVSWANAGPLGINEAVVDGETIRFSFGASLRSRWERIGPDSFLVVRERRDGDAWREDRRVTYRRIGAAR